MKLCVEKDRAGHREESALMGLGLSVASWPGYRWQVSVKSLTISQVNLTLCLGKALGITGHLKIHFVHWPSVCPVLVPSGSVCLDPSPSYLRTLPADICCIAASHQGLVRFHDEGISPSSPPGRRDGNCWTLGTPSWPPALQDAPGTRLCFSDTLWCLSRGAFP